jgi:hypothetical protein
MEVNARKRKKWKVGNKRVSFYIKEKTSIWIKIDN